MDAGQYGDDCSEFAASEDAAGQTGEEDGPEAFVLSCAHMDTDSSRQCHVHEFTGSTSLLSVGALWHGHRFSGMSGEAIYVPGSHVHRLVIHTDYAGHYHELRCISGPATFLYDCAARKSDKKHVHLAEGTTANASNHRHKFIFATLIEAPLDDEDAADRD